MPTIDSQQPAASSLGEYANERDEETFWREIAPRREPLAQRWFLPTVLLLVVLSVPWYLPAHWIDRLIGGLPLWTWMALGFSVGLAAVTSWMALRHWHDGEDG